MKKILFIAGSNSAQSINRQLLEFASLQLQNGNNSLLDLREYPLPLYDPELEQNEGIPENALKLASLVETHSALVIAVAEHNGSVTAFFKNILDWLSRAGKDYRIFRGKEVVLLSTSPGSGAAQSALAHAEDILKRLSATIVGRFSLPSFYENVNHTGSGISLKDENQQNKLKLALAPLQTGALAKQSI